MGQDQSRRAKLKRRRRRLKRLKQRVKEQIKSGARKKPAPSEASSS